MKTKLCLLLLLSALILSACGANTAVQNDSSSANEKTVVKQKENEPKKESGNSSELEDLGDVDVDEGLFNVEITIPESYLDGQTQKDLDNVCKEEGYKSITLNDDGSATYVMTKKQHKDMMDEMTNSLNESLNDLIGSKDYPNFTDIKANDNFTEFTITTKSTELDMSESFSAMMFYMYGGMYNIFNGTETDNVSVTFVNAETGETISTSNSSDMGE